MNDGLAPSEEEFQAYLDGCLDEPAKSRVDRYLLANPDAAEKIKQMQRLDDQLRELGKSVLQEPVPDRLRGATQSSSGRSEA
jgi:anti-sigma factor RsiW